MAKIETAGMSLDASALFSLTSLKETFGMELGRLWHDIGYEARKAAKMQLLSGQKITFRGANPWVDKKGRRKVGWSVLRKQRGVKVVAYPLNFKRYQPILKRDLKQISTQKLHDWTSNFMKKYEH